MISHIGSFDCVCAREEANLIGSLSDWEDTCALVTIVTATIVLAALITHTHSLHQPVMHALVDDEWMDRANNNQAIVNQTPIVPNAKYTESTGQNSHPISHGLDQDGFKGPQRGFNVGNQWYLFDVWAIQMTIDQLSTRLDSLCWGRAGRKRQCSTRTNDQGEVVGPRLITALPSPSTDHNGCGSFVSLANYWAIEKAYMPI